MIGIKIPWQVFACAGLVVAFGGWGELRHYQGKQEIQAEWDAAVERGRSLVEGLKSKQGEVTTRTVTVYQDRIKVIREKGETITKYVDRYIPVDASLPGGFRLLHDAAATNTLPGAPGGANDYPTSLTDATRTITQNYSQYYQCREQVVSWQRWASEQRRAYLELCKQQGARCNEDSL